MSATPCIRISPALAALGDRGFVHGRTQHRLQRTSPTQYGPESRDTILARPQLGPSNVSAPDYSSINGLSSHQLQPPVEAPSILGDHNITLTFALTRHEEGFLAFCEASDLADGSNQRLSSPASAPKPLASLVSSLPPPSSALGGSIQLQEDGRPCRDCPGAPILDVPDPHYDYGTHPYGPFVPTLPSWCNFFGGERYYRYRVLGDTDREHGPPFCRTNYAIPIWKWCQCAWSNYAAPLASK